MEQLRRSEMARRHMTLVGLARAWSKDVVDTSKTEDDIYTKINVDADLVEFGEEEIDEDSFKTAHET